MNNSIFGYFDAPEQVTPVFDPGLDVACPVCHKILGPHTPDNRLKAISVIAYTSETNQFADDRCYFYRAHADCYNNLSVEEQADIDGLIVDARYRLKDVN